MTRFTTRIVLHDADLDDYAALQEHMAAEGFARTLLAKDGTSYLLPHAEYDFRGKLSKQKVLEKAKAAAAHTGKTPAILVTESAGRAWFNLPSG
jgi:hypothetical protein